MPRTCAQRLACGIGLPALDACEARPGTTGAVALTVPNAQSPAAAEAVRRPAPQCLAGQGLRRLAGELRQAGGQGALRADQRDTDRTQQTTRELWTKRETERNERPCGGRSRKLQSQGASTEVITSMSAFPLTEKGALTTAESFMSLSSSQ